MWGLKALVKPVERKTISAETRGSIIYLLRVVRTAWGVLLFLMDRQESDHCNYNNNDLWYAFNVFLF